MFAGNLLLVALLMLLFLNPVSADAADNSRPPNLILLLTDDQRWDTLGCAGNRLIRTPHIDRLAARGTMFRNAFVATSICSVSRASLFSGQYARRHGIEDFATPFSPAAWSNTYPATLRRHGYLTGFIGKFGVGNEMPEAAFDYWDGFPGQGRFFEKDNPRHLTARMGDSALKFLGDQSAARPFCLSISFKAPHAQDRAPREFPPDPRDESLYAGVKMPVAPTATEEFFQAQPPFVRDSENRVRWQRRFADPEMHQNTVRDYYRLITGVDREVGRILESLEQLGLADNTVIVFTSDNGFFLGERGLAGKWLMHEESIRVPMIVFDPRAPRGRKVDDMALNIDVAPTLLDYAGVPVPDAMQGRSLRPIAAGKGVRDWRGDWFYEHHFTAGVKIPASEGVRTERWKYIRYVSADPVVEELYDLKRDPLERRNLAADPKHRKAIDQLRNRWTEYREELQ